VRLFEELRGLPAGAPVRPALYRACAKVAQQRPPLFRRPAPRALAPNADPGAQAACLLQQALARLPARERIVFVLNEVLGLSAKDVQAATELSQSALDSHLRRARLALTEALRFADEAAETEVAP
jgi:DNA-directed RNA polymerase specialized sigma24 family protein